MSIKTPHWPFWKTIAISVFAVLLVGAAIVSFCLIRAHEDMGRMQNTPEGNVAVVKQLTVPQQTTPAQNVEIVKSLQIK